MTDEKARPTPDDSRTDALPEKSERKELDAEIVRDLDAGDEAGEARGGIRTREP